MALNFTSTDQAGLAGGIKGFIYGESGAGKTTAIGTLPEGMTVILSAEAGLLSVRNKRHTVLLINTIDDLTDAYNWACSPEGAQFPFWGLDSITEIAEKVLANSKATCKDPRQAYGELIDKMTDYIKKFRDLYGRHVFMSAKMEMVKDEVSGLLLRGPSMPGTKLGPALPYLFDEVFYIGVGEQVNPDGSKTPFRYIQTEKDTQHLAKDRSGVLAKIEPPDLTYIVNKILTTPIKQAGV